jgi:hypothetical protein
MPKKTPSSSKQKASITSNPPAAPIQETKSLAASAAPGAESAVSAIETSRPESRKFEIVKNDSRKNIVPINLDDEIRRRAYELAERRGFELGHENEDWLAAEREVLQRYHQQSA